MDAATWQGGKVRRCTCPRVAAYAPASVPCLLNSTNSRCASSGSISMPHSGKSVPSTSTGFPPLMSCGKYVWRTGACLCVRGCEGGAVELDGGKDGERGGEGFQSKLRRERGRWSRRRQRSVCGCLRAASHVAPVAWRLVLIGASVPHDARSTTAQDASCMACGTLSMARDPCHMVHAAWPSMHGP
eukprot:357017-Chlamydomonas_euryale.AAC.1